MNHLIPWLLLVSFLIGGGLAPRPLCGADTPALQPGGVRVVFVGDSITGLGGGWLNTGFTFPMRAALQAAYPGCEPQLVALGGSGMGVNSWLGLARGPLATEQFLDVKGVGVKATLSEPADVLVIMLGMNDLLAPYVGDTPGEIDRWRDQYRELVGLLRAQLQPKVIGLASITMQTEDPQSAKNRVLAALNDRVRGLAQELNCRYLPVSEAIWEVQHTGRTFDPQFHTTYDLIHPNPIGQIAIAVGMLRGFGETRAAAYLVDQKVASQYAVLTKGQPPLSYEVTAGTAPWSADAVPFRVHYWWPGTNRSAPRVRLVAPAGWTVKPAAVAAATGEFAVTGPPDHLQNRLQLEASAGTETARREIIIPAPWRVTGGFVQDCWNGPGFQPDKARTEVDAALESGGDFLALVTAAADPHAGWHRYFTSADYKGGSNPGSVDFGAVVHGRNFEAGYGARWIHSDRDRPVELHLFTMGLAARIHLAVWVNGARVYSHQLPGKPVPVRVELRRGWNTLVFKSNHFTWEWQNTIELAPVAGESLDDLRFAVRPSGP